MKTTLFALFLFFFALVSAKPAFVDTDGNNIINGGYYYILPVVWGPGGGVDIASTSNETCPLSVVQTSSELFNGSPIRISSPHKIAELETNYILDLTVVAPPSCADTPATLTVVSEDDATAKVKLAGYGNAVSGWFKVQALNGFWMKKGVWIYKIEFCPTVGNSCGDVGISYDDKGNRLLAISHNNPFMVVFGKAESSAE
ncbi:trypsin inhibitor DE-3-like [Neltuma alba]|uniref:trypsin inhibitor DE-3-like n=1 Tax=Neltuma alba TaxID=207710 RepID=UPI0010A361D7|nr:trypsin inhibitor DE-3-like [Prosopis alba]